MSGWPGFYLENWIYFLKREHIEFPFFKKKKKSFAVQKLCNMQYPIHQDLPGATLPNKYF